MQQRQRVAETVITLGPVRLDAHTVLRILKSLVKLVQRSVASTTIRIVHVSLRVSLNGLCVPLDGLLELAWREANGISAVVHTKENTCMRHCKPHHSHNSPFQQFGTPSFFALACTRQPPAHRTTCHTAFATPLMQTRRPRASHKQTIPAVLAFLLASPPRSAAQQVWKRAESRHSPFEKKAFPFSFISCCDADQCRSANCAQQ